MSGRDETVDAIVIGAGFGGMMAIQRLRAMGLSVQGFEQASGVGGTWYWNRYPGARCDSETPVYQYFFSDELAREWTWSERYPAQGEILDYLNWVADRLDLRRHYRFDTAVTALAYDEASRLWTATTADGDSLSARYCITALGCLSAPKTPEIEGVERFRGRTYFTSAWPHEPVDFTNQRVAVIGTGSSGIQAIPLIAAQAAQLTVFQRTANFSIPAKNRPLSEAEKAEHKANFDAYRTGATSSNHGHLPRSAGPCEAEIGREDEDFLAAYRTHMELGGFGLLNNFDTVLVDERVNDLAAQVVRDHIRTTVKDPAVAEALIPTDHPIGTKRPCLDTHYYETFNRPTVSLVDLRQAPISAITEDAIVAGGQAYPVDAIVFATGFDAVTGPLLRIDIRGKGGRSLRDKWADGPETYLGLMMAGFPNLFTVTGPLSPSVLSNMPAAIDQHVNWIVDCIAMLEAKGGGAIEARPDKESAWGEHARTVADHTLYPKAASWYMGANVPGKPRTILPYLGGMIAYRQACDEAAADDYQAFEVSAA